MKKPGVSPVSRRCAPGSRTRDFSGKTRFFRGFKIRVFSAGGKNDTFRHFFGAPRDILRVKNNLFF